MIINAMDAVLKYFTLHHLLFKLKLISIPCEHAFYLKCKIDVLQNVEHVGQAGEQPGSFHNGDFNEDGAGLAIAFRSDAG